VNGDRERQGRATTPRLYTIGHSTRSFEEFAAALESFAIACLIDVRTVPRSRRVPQFNHDSLARALPAVGVEYVHLPELGGWRKPLPGSPNAGWRNASLRGYADYMVTPEFEAAIEHLMKIAREKPSAVMCAEAVPYRCHRSLIADALTVRGWEVPHILGVGRAEPHRLTPFAQVDGTRIIYPAPA